MLDIARFLIDSVVNNPQLAIVLTALTALGVAAFAIYVLLRVVLTLGKRR